MELTTAVAEALRMKHLKDGPETFPLPLSGVRVGPVAFLGIPGEPFTGIGPGAERRFAVCHDAAVLPDERRGGLLSQ